MVMSWGGHGDELGWTWGGHCDELGWTWVGHGDELVMSWGGYGLGHHANVETCTKLHASLYTHT